MKASIILSTYNRPQALLTVLEALNLQTIQDFEGKMTEDFVLHQLATMPSG